MIGVQKETDDVLQVSMEGQKLTTEQQQPPPKEDPNEWPQTRVDLLTMAVAKHGENFNTIIADRIFKRLADYSPRFLKLKWESILRKAQATMNSNMNPNANGHPLSSYSTSRTDTYGGMTISTTTTVTYSPAPPSYSSAVSSAPQQGTSPGFLSYPLATAQPPSFSSFPAAAAVATPSLLPPTYPSSCASPTTTSSTYLAVPSPATSSSPLPLSSSVPSSLEDLKTMMTNAYAPAFPPCLEGESPVEIKTKSRKPSTKKQFIGCTFRPTKEVWVAEIERDGEVLYLGQFRAPERAAKAYDVAAIALYGRKTVLNFPKIRYTQESVDTEKKVLAQKKGRPLAQLKAMLDANPEADMRSEEEKAEDKLLALHADEEEAASASTNAVEEGKKAKKATATAKKKKNGDETVFEKPTQKVDAPGVTKGKKGRKPKSETSNNNDEKVKLVRGPKQKRKLSLLGLDIENPAGNVDAAKKSASEKKKTSANGETKVNEEGEEDEGEEGDAEEAETEAKRKQKSQAKQDDSSKRVAPLLAAFRELDKTTPAPVADPFLNRTNVAPKPANAPPPPQQVELVPDRSTTYQQFEHDSPAFRGVTTREGKTIKYRASIKDKGIAIFLGTFSTKAAAARHYDLAALTLHHERAVTNFAQVSYTRAELQAMATKLRNKGCLATPPPQMMYGLPAGMPVKSGWSTERDAEPANDDDPAMELRDDTDPNDPCYRVPMWRRDIQRKITGNAAPMRKNLAQYLVDHPDCEVFTKQIARRYRKKTDASFDGTPPEGEQYEYDPNYDPQYDQQSLGNMCSNATYPFPPFPGISPGFPASPYPYMPNIAQYYGAYMGFPQPTPQQQLQLQQLQQLQQQQLQQQQQQLQQTQQQQQQQQTQQQQQQQQQQLQQLQLHLQQQQQLQLQQQQKNTPAAPNSVPLLAFVDGNKEKKVAECDTKANEDKLDGDVKTGSKKDDKSKEDKAKTKKRKTDDGESDENKLAKFDKEKLKIDKKKKMNDGIPVPLSAPSVSSTTVTTATSAAVVPPSPSPALNIGSNGSSSSTGGSTSATTVAAAAVAAAAVAASNASSNPSSVPLLPSSHPPLSPFLSPPVFPSNNNSTAAAAMAVAIARAVFLNTPGSAAPPSLTHPFAARPPLMHQGHRPLLPPRPMPPLNARPSFSQVPVHPQLSPSSTATTTSTSNAHPDHWFATSAFASTSSSPSTSTTPPWFPSSSFPPSSSWYAPSPVSSSPSGNYNDNSRFGIWGEKNRDESNGWADTEKVNEIENFENTWGDESNRRPDGISDKSTGTSSS